MNSANQIVQGQAAAASLSALFGLSELIYFFNSPLTYLHFIIVISNIPPSKDHRHFFSYISNIFDKCVLNTTEILH